MKKPDGKLKNLLKTLRASHKGTVTVATEGTLRSLLEIRYGFLILTATTGQQAERVFADELLKLPDLARYKVVAVPLEELAEHLTQVSTIPAADEIVTAWQYGDHRIYTWTDSEDYDKAGSRRPMSDYLTVKEHQMIDQLHHRGFSVITWSPAELKGADYLDVEGHCIDAGRDIIAVLAEEQENEE